MQRRGTDTLRDRGYAQRKRVRYNARRDYGGGACAANAMPYAYRRRESGRYAENI